MSFSNILTFQTILTNCPSSMPIMLKSLAFSARLERLVHDTAARVCLSWVARADSLYLNNNKYLFIKKS